MSGYPCDANTSCPLPFKEKSLKLPVSPGETVWSRQTSVAETRSSSKSTCVTDWSRQSSYESWSDDPFCESLPDLTDRLVELGVHENYKIWHAGYRRWREGEANGASGEVTAVTNDPPDAPKCLRDAYRTWRTGGSSGATASEAFNEQLYERLAPLQSPDLPPVIYDIVACDDGQPALLPADGPVVDPLPIKDFPPDAIVTIRVVRFLEDRSDAEEDWEKNLTNVNSGSISWLPWHLAPKMHNKNGAKYGSWFNIHFVEVYAKHFTSAYHMCNGGNCGAKTFGTSKANSTTITFDSLPKGQSYFWYVSPAGGKDQMQSKGWQHLKRRGPFDGNAFLHDWQQRGSSMQPRALQLALAQVVARS